MKKLLIQEMDEVHLSNQIQKSGLRRAIHTAFLSAGYSMHCAHIILLIYKNKSLH